MPHSLREQSALLLSLNLRKLAASKCLLMSFSEWGGRTQQKRGTRLLAGGGSECQALVPAHCACAGVALGLGASWLSHTFLVTSPKELFHDSIPCCDTC